MALSGSIRVPSDKSLSHRAVLFSALAKGTSHLEDLLPSDDVRSSIAAMRALGARIELEEGAHGLSGTVTGFAGEPPQRGPLTIDCGNSGTTTRLLIGLLAGLGVDVELVGDASLSRRPMRRVTKLLEPLGARIETTDGHLPVHILPSDGLEARAVTTEQASAQVKSAVLLAGLTAQGTTSVTEPAKSRDHTERLLPAFGVPVEVEGNTASLEGPARLHAHDMSIPADPSSAAFVAVAASLIPGSSVTIESVALNETRIGALACLERMGADIAFADRHYLGAEPVGDVVVNYSSGLSGTDVPSDEIPALIDEIPVLALAAAKAHGETVFFGAGELRVKESDRFSAILELMEALGVRAWGEGDDLHIMGDAGAESVAGPFSISTRHDHRLAMTDYLASKIFRVKVDVDDAACVSVSWPGFYRDLASIEVSA
ncbi:MAG: 3-phosphoshikimate 1-carboxyvinyltransferase [Coriobacteriales bacterium]|jgi:3-phosphoshikimate 1-carboxyvinyltransferase